MPGLVDGLPAHSDCGSPTRSGTVMGNYDALKVQKPTGWSKKSRWRHINKGGVSISTSWAAILRFSTTLWIPLNSKYCCGRQRCSNSLYNVKSPWGTARIKSRSAAILVHGRFSHGELTSGGVPAKTGPPGVMLLNFSVPRKPPALPS